MCRRTKRTKMTPVTAIDALRATVVLRARRGLVGAVVVTMVLMVASSRSQPRHRPGACAAFRSHTGHCVGGITPVVGIRRGRRSVDPGRGAHRRAVARRTRARRPAVGGRDGHSALTFVL